MAESDAREHGFTLVELMVVLVIIGLAAAAVVLAMPEQGGSLAGEAERFAARAKAARDQAILDSRPVALRIGQGGYEVMRRRDGGWRTEAHYDWAGGTRPDPSGDIRFDPTGMTDPVRLVLRRGERRTAIDISGDGGVHVAR